MTTRIRETSAFKKSLLKIPVGSQVEIGPVQGGFILLEDPSRPLVFITDEIGITPFMSMLRFVGVKEENIKQEIFSGY